MTEFDDKLRANLSADDEAFLKDLEDGRGLFAQLGATFEGPMRYWSVFGWVIITVLTAFGIYAIWRMFQTDTDRALILWAGAAWAAWTAQIAMKQWVFDRMATLTILRELKKIELRVARMEDKRG